jgi:hypothetical protein
MCVRTLGIAALLAGGWGAMAFGGQAATLRLADDFGVATLDGMPRDAAEGWRRRVASRASVVECGTPVPL